MRVLTGSGPERIVEPAGVARADGAVAAIRSIPYLAALADSEVAELASRATVASYGAREMVTLEGADARAFFLLMSGKARVFRAAPEGREQTLRLLAAGDTFGEVPVFDSQPMPATVETIEPSEVLLIPAGAFRACVSRNPEVALALLSYFARRIRAFNELIAHISLQTVQSRVARYLYHLAREEGTAVRGGVLVQREVTQQDLASLLGSAREVVSRTFRSLADEGLIEFDRSRVLIRDMDGLARLF